MTDEQLLSAVQSSFESSLADDKKAASLLEKINAGKGNYVVAGDYAERVGESLRKAYQTNISGIDGAMHWSTAKAVIEPTLEEEYDIVSTAATTVQQSLNTKAGMGLKAVKASYNSEAVSGIMNKVCSYESYDAAAWVLRDAAVSFARSVVDRTLKANIDFQGKAGRAARVIRRAGFKCCDWCADLEGIYEYPNTPEDIYRRHDNCRCDVEYDPGNGKVQNVHTKEWRDADERDRIEERKGFGLAASDKNTIVKPHSSPVLLGKVDYQDKDAVMSAIRDYEEKIAESTIENAIVITKSGNIVQCLGVSEAVYPDADLGDEIIGAYVTHNHTAGSSNEYSFSAQDVELFNDYNLTVLRGEDEKYIYELSRLTNDVDEHLTIDELSASDGESFRHEEMISYAERMGLGYRRWKR